jgi:hypothetical protein
MMSVLLFCPYDGLVMVVSLTRDSSYTYITQLSLELWPQSPNKTTLAF